MKQRNKNRVCLVAYHRDKLSLGVENEWKYGLAIFHWALLVRPKDASKVQGWTCFDVADTALIDPVTGEDTNPEHHWRFREQDVDPFSDPRFLGGIVIGKLAKEVSTDSVSQLLVHVTLPETGRMDQNCVSWARDAILALQAAGVIKVSKVDALFTAVKQLGKDTIQGGRSMVRPDAFLEA